jgi:3-deoxy-7-phosphoheptulonate synthase
MGQSDLVTPMSRAAIAVGADGLIVETHNDPANALCDGQQSLDPKEMADLLKQIKNIASVIGKKVR